MENTILKGFGQKDIKRGHAVFVGLLPLLLILILTQSICLAQLTGNDVLILVNSDSPTSRYIAKIYCQYHPDVPLENVLELTGLTDCSGKTATPADEIISRGDYEQLIAQPLRDFLVANNLTTAIKVIITTAGMPYRIEDTVYSDAVYPAGSNAGVVSGNLPFINAASVESELTCLWYSDYGPGQFSSENRMVNVYQGYRQSSIASFERLQPGSKTMQWTDALNVVGDPPKIEGENGWGFPPVYGATNRSFNAGDIYLTCRLDGPKTQGGSAIFEVHKMLERAKRASDPAKGVNPLQAVVVLDDAPGADDYDENRIYNLDGSANYIVYDPNVNQPPDAKTILIKDDYAEAFTTLTNCQSNENVLNIGLMMGYGGDLPVMLDRRNNTRTSQADLDNYAASDPNRDEYQGIVLAACFGRNGDEGSASNYLLCAGPNNTPLFNAVNGAVFTSIESFNAVTMFSDVNTLPTAQGKIVDFITIGGTGAIGHAFEPMAGSVPDNLYLHYNLLADEDADGVADLTFVEAAFTAIPFLSWSEVVIGDPLMRIHYGPGGAALMPIPGDIGMDGYVNVKDVRELKKAYGGSLYSTTPYYYERYNDRADLNGDFYVNVMDARILKTLMY
ncbi:MAG: hypothetical protein K8R02_04195 [Anaerohalosphaeraceae bacterium]|nr:hypothetical protein [Anaerohalosphaeraceae bacterium]